MAASCGRRVRVGNLVGVLTENNVLSTIHPVCLRMKAFIRSIAGPA
jgi:hypothetical protein